MERFGSRVETFCMNRFIALLGVVLPAFFALPARSESGQVEKFFANQGCAIGPSTIAAAIAGGIERSEVEAYAAAMRADPKNMKTGEWVVLGEEGCEIRPPAISSEIRISDPEVVASLSAMNAYAEYGDIGCFLDGSKLFETVQSTRGWDADKANLEYLRFLGQSVISGELSFYSADPVRTPPGIIATRGACAETPHMPEIRRSHALLMKHFNALIRTDAAKEELCPSRSGPSWKFAETAEQVFGEKPTNAFLFMDLSLIAWGAGWYEGTTSRNKGTPRPPLCRYE